eukprot:GHUV01032377.1.p1 GENE.GHUV01032377.1~~GHUV01032377.1.p1  ORF type:complete len:265 (+),score=48.86 GHUV01032377.1:261-1055(+)
MGNSASQGAGPAAMQSPAPTVTFESPATKQAAPTAQAPQGAINGSCKFMIIENEHIKIGVDPSRGAGICYLAKGGTDDNVLNEYDCGRFVQQSYYGKVDGSNWNGQPWRWNPVQCGSWQNRPARINRCQCDKPGHIVTEVNPCNWAGQELLENVVMKADITVEGKHAHVRFTMTYMGTDMHEVRIQELPAVFLTRRLSELVFYDGPNPWQGQALQRKKPGFPNENYRITENWAAYIDPSTGEGVGIYTPVAQTLTCYRYALWLP